MLMVPRPKPRSPSPATAGWSIANPATNVADPHRKLLSTLRLKVLLSLFVVLLVVALSGLIVTLVSGIFARLTPMMREDLEWKAQRGALELSQTADLAIAVGDAGLIQKAFGDYRNTPDVLAIVAVDAQHKVLATHGKPPVAPRELFRGPEGEVRAGDKYLISWAPSVIEGNTVGRTAVVISTARLAEGDRLRRHLLAVAAMGCLLALGVSLLFVNYYLVPLINVTQQGLRHGRDMEIAQRIQTSILPRQVRIPAIEFSAAMVPADEVGGDYYDLLPAENGDGCWIGIGDVAGHGVRAGLIMMMVQSVVSGLARRKPECAPGELLEVLNSVLFENIRHRLRSDEHVTFSVLRLHDDGRLLFSGAHEELIVLRAATGRCERVETPGTWIGAVANIHGVSSTKSIHLLPGDILVLHTDGVTEAENSSGEQFGIERLCKELERSRNASADELRARALGAVTRWMSKQKDDLSLLVIRYRGTSV
jgi:hypothetical protein